MIFVTDNSFNVRYRENRTNTTTIGLSINQLISIFIVA